MLKSWWILYDSIQTYFIQTSSLSRIVWLLFCDTYSIQTSSLSRMVWLLFCDPYSFQASSPKPNFMTINLLKFSLCRPSGSLHFETWDKASETARKCSFWGILKGMNFNTGQHFRILTTRCTTSRWFATLTTKCLQCLYTQYTG